MKKGAIFVLAIVSLVLLSTYAAAWPTNGPNLDDKMNVHQRLTYMAIKAVYQDDPKLGEILMKYQNQLLYGAYDEDWRGGNVTINGKTYTLESQYHFIDPLDHAGLFVTDIVTGHDVSAADKAQELYEKAVQLWKAGNYTGAMLYLGRTVHILEDASMIIAHNTPHLFEVLEEFKYAENAHDFVENEISPTVADDTVDGWSIRNIVVHANFDPNSPSGFKTLDGREYSKVQWAVYQTMQYDIRLVAGLMEKFFEDVGVTG